MSFLKTLNTDTMKQRSFIRHSWDEPLSSQKKDFKIYDSFKSEF